MTAAAGLNAQEVTEYLDRVWPGVTSSMTMEEVADRRARLRMHVGENGLRPGRIVSGPALMSLADSAVWAAIIGVLGDAAMGVTVSLTIHFLRPAGRRDCRGQLHRVQQRLATAMCSSPPKGRPSPSRRPVTYALPQ